MNKNDIYRLIGYQGEYNASVKKAIRKLLKENHPDNKGDRKKFELINEVKKELELGKVSYKKRKDEDTKTHDGIDYEYCYQMIMELKKKKMAESDSLLKKRELLSKYEMEYKDLYNNSLDVESKLLTKSPYLKKFSDIKKESFIFIIILIIIFLASILLKNKYLLFIFIVLTFFGVLIAQKYMYYIHKMTATNSQKLSDYVALNNKIRKNVSKQEEIKKEILVIKKNMTLIENDLRFYKNLLK